MGVVNGNRGERRSVTGVAPPSPPVAVVDEFDPLTSSVMSALAFVREHPEERDRVLAAERAGKNRVTLLHALIDE